MLKCKMSNLCHLKHWLQHVLKTEDFYFPNERCFCVWAEASLGCLSACACDADTASVGMTCNCCCVLSLRMGSLYRVELLYFTCASPSVVSKVFMCLLKSSCNVNETSAVFLHHPCECVENPQNIVKDSVLLLEWFLSWLMSLFSA